jgi:hypothetical protein
LEYGATVAARGHDSPRGGRRCFATPARTCTAVPAVLAVSAGPPLLHKCCISLTAFVTESIEGSAVPATIAAELERQLRGVPAEIERILADEATVASVLEPVVREQLEGFDSAAVESRLQRAWASAKSLLGKPTPGSSDSGGLGRGVVG